MRYNSDINRLMLDRNYQAAMHLLRQIIAREHPSTKSLSLLFGPYKTDFIQRSIYEFLSSGVGSGRTPRPHTPNAPTEISDKRSQLEADPKFQEVQFMLLCWRLPSLDLLHELYGPYAVYVRKALQIYLQKGLRRQCGISSTAHANRVGAIARALGMDTGGSAKYSAIAALHDTIEDLLLIASDKDGRHFALDRFSEFLEYIAPQEIHGSLVLLSNHYDLILGSIDSQLRFSDQLMTPKALLAALETLAGVGLPSIAPYAARMYSLLRERDIQQSTYETSKWLCYRELYIRLMAEQSREANDFRTFEIKALDLSDNAHGRDALAMSGREKNIIKMDIWARAGYSLQSAWAPLNNHIMELEEDALVHAEHLIIKDFLEPVSSQDFVASALVKIKELESVFYVEASG